MFSDKEYDLWCLQCGFTLKARRLIDQIRKSKPVRKVKGSGKNVIGQYPSRKMGRTLQFESHRCELSYIQQLEYDDDVIELWDQPVEFKRFTYITKSGRKHVGRHVPDFFVCRRGYSEFVECKTEDELTKLAEDSPHRFCRGENGKWRCPPGEEYTEPFGIRYTLHSTANINPVYIRNIEFLDDYLRQDSLQVSEEARQFILSIVRSESGITLSDLLKRVLEVEA